MVAKRHKITNVPLLKKLWDIIFFFWDNNFLSHLGVKKVEAPLKMSREMAQKVIVPKKENYVPKFLKQRDIGNFRSFFATMGPQLCPAVS